MLVHNVSYSYSNFALNNIDLQVKKGSVVCLLGHSGCGKSTILRLIAGIATPQSGEIFINEKLVASSKVSVAIESRNVGLIFQHSALFLHKTVIENVIFGIKGFTKKEKYNIAMEILQLLKVDIYKDIYPSTLSGGQQQLIAIARVIAQNPDVLLLDEPFSNLDVLLKRQVRQFILSLFRKRNIPILMVTHDPQEALEVADFIYIMKDGQIIHSSPASDISEENMLKEFFYIAKVYN
ncbi:MAG: ABC transporter ATP-binding protein [Wolbachia endosymbiont of Fragariocoptes setiger]|nr:ABC transporter ATP-binding protein [Wolbachia endosymbiont of Fragariocoptes setiger]